MFENVDDESKTRIRTLLAAAHLVGSLEESEGRAPRWALDKYARAIEAVERDVLSEEQMEQALLLAHNARLDGQLVTTV